MDKQRCRHCQEYKRCQNSYISWFFFIVGLVAAVAIRAVTFLLHLNPLYGKISWYIGVIGFVIFFVYKFYIMQSRAKLIGQHNLVEKINRGQPLSEQDYSLISVILCALSSKKEQINYLFIFVLSAVALVFAVYMDFFQ